LKYTRFDIFFLYWIYDKRYQQCSKTSRFKFLLLVSPSHLKLNEWMNCDGLVGRFQEKVSLDRVNPFGKSFISIISCKQPSLPLLFSLSVRQGLAMYPGWSWTIDPYVLASHMLELQACTTTSGLYPLSLNDRPHS
jgi:hypothetical protein